MIKTGPIKALKAYTTLTLTGVKHIVKGEGLELASNEIQRKSLVSKQKAKQVLNNSDAE